MKALIIIPPLDDFYFTQNRFSILGALKTAELIEKHSGIDVEIINFPVMEKKQTALPGYLNYLKNYTAEGETGSCSFFSLFRKYGPGVDKCVQIVKNKNPDIIFFSLFAYCYAEPAIELAKLLKKEMPEIPLVAGGAGVSVFPEYFNPFFDQVLPGEAEITVPSYIQNFINKTKNIYDNISSSFSDSSLKKMDIINSGMFLKRKSEYTNSCGDIHTESGQFGLSLNIASSDKKSVYISTVLSRGCNNRCRFCSNFITHGRNFRTVPVENVKKDLEQLKNLFFSHINKKFFINFEDDNLLTEKDYFLSVLNIFISFFSRYTERDKILFSAENGLDYNLMTKDICKILIEENFRQFNFTLGSVKRSIITKEKRGGSINHLNEILNILKIERIPAVLYFIAGLKNDTAEAVVDSLLFIADSPAIAGISMFYSVPGLPDFSDTEYFRSKPPGLLRGSSAYPWNNSLTSAQLITAFRISRTINLYKKKELSPGDLLLSDLIRKEKKLFTLVKKNKKLTPVRPPGIDRKMEADFFNRYIFS